MWNYVRENLFLFYIIQVIINLPEFTAFPYIIKINVANIKTFFILNLLLMHN